MAMNRRQMLLASGAALLGPAVASRVLAADDKGTPKGNDHKRGKLLAAIERDLGEQGVALFEAVLGALSSALWTLQRRSCEALVLAMNEALFVVGAAFLERYQALKAERRVLDFSDLEWQAWRLLNNEEHAAYLQSRLDSRYSHILLDEFQDFEKEMVIIYIAYTSVVLIT